jgi:hypothetical protein
VAKLWKKLKLESRKDQSKKQNKKTANEKCFEIICLMLANVCFRILPFFVHGKNKFSFKHGIN